MQVTAAQTQRFVFLVFFTMPKFSSRLETFFNITSTTVFCCYTSILAVFWDGNSTSHVGRADSWSLAHLTVFADFETLNLISEFYECLHFKQIYLKRLIKTFYSPQTESRTKKRGRPENLATNAPV